MANGKYNAPLYQLEGIIIKLCQNGKDIQHYKTQCDQQENRQEDQDLGNGRRNVHNTGQGGDIKNQKCCDQENGNTQSKALLKIGAKRMEKGLENSGFLSTLDFQRHIVQCGQGRAYGNDWQAAEDKNQVQDNQICYPIQKTVQRAIHFEEMHSASLGKRRLSLLC